jgi:hypothetical protein
MPTLPVFFIRIFSGSYKFIPLSVRQKVTNVVKKWVKKLSVGKIITDLWGSKVPVFALASFRLR